MAEGGSVIKVTNEIRVYEIDNKETTGRLQPRIEVESHWNRPDFIKLVLDGKSYTVVASDLTAAIRNAANTARH